MEKEEFKEKWKNLSNELKNVILDNRAQFYTDYYLISIDGLDILFELNGKEIGTCNLKNIERIL
jgi:hypothetical protein